MSIQCQRIIRCAARRWTADRGVSSAPRRRLGTAVPAPLSNRRQEARQGRAAGRRGSSSFDRSVRGRTTRARPRRHAEHGGQPPKARAFRPAIAAPARDAASGTSCIHVVEAMVLVALVGVALLAFRLSSGPIYLEWLHDRIVSGLQERVGGAYVVELGPTYVTHDSLGRRTGLPQPEAQGSRGPHGALGAARPDRRRSVRRVPRRSPGAAARTRRSRPPAPGRGRRLAVDRRRRRRRRRADRLAEQVLRASKA